MNTFRHSAPSRGSFLSLLGIAGLVLAGVQSAQCADWPQYRGANHDGVCSEDVLKTWPAALPEVWKVPTTDGFSSFAVAEGIATTIVGRNDQETCIALDAATGKELWSATLGKAKFDGGGDSGADDNKGGDGPRSTPTIDGGRVYALSGYMVLACWDAKTGKSIWSKDLVAEAGAKIVHWQSAASPLIEGDLVFVCTGSTNSLMAFNKLDGKVAWKSQDDEYTHSTPIATTILGTRQVIFFTHKGLVSVVPTTGDILWRYSFPWNVATAASPIVSGDLVYCAAGYGVGSGTVKITKEGDAFKATEIWRKKGNAFGNHWASPVAKDGFLFGIFEHGAFGKAPLKCLEIATGKEMWAHEGFGPGGLMLVGGNILVLNDRGELVLVEGSTTAYKELGKAKAIDGKCWNTFALSNGHLFARSTKQGVCLDVSGK